jgi:hypothetical protein
MAEQVKTEVQNYLSIIDSYDTEFKKWEQRVTKILKRYRDDNRGPQQEQCARFNILWANVQTLVPAVYARLPQADVSRRFGDNDPVGRVASMLLERVLNYEIEHYTDFRSSMRQCVEDRFLGGRGVSWVRYEPHVATQDMPEDGIELTDVIETGGPDDYDDEGDGGDGPDDRTAGADEPPEQIEYECTPTDYVHWKDFGHSSARTWEEVGQVWRWVYMTKEALKERFPDKWQNIPLDSGPDPLNVYTKANRINNDKAKICELWDKETGRIVWLSKHLPELIEELPDPLNLEGFFPCPKPLYATTTSDNLVPVPDYVLYQDQANELDILSDRIDGLVKALRVRGVYDSSQPALQRLLTEGDNNTLIPVDKWAAFTEKGGLKGSIDLLPLDTLASALLQCYQARDNIKGQVYEITGIADIVRGETAASETATAQQIKGQYANLRLKSMQDTVAVFASGLLRIKAEIICEKYQDKTILAYAGASQFSQQDQKLIPQALQLIRDNPLQSFRIEVDADSLVQLDEQQTKQDRLEFLNAFSNFLREAMPAGQQSPQIVPMLMAMVKYGVGGFKAAKSLEGDIDQALDALKAAAVQQAANPKPTPEQMKMQAEQQALQMKTQADVQTENIKAQSAQAVANIQAQSAQQLEQARIQHQMAMETTKLTMQETFEKWKAELDNATKVMVARISANPGADIVQLQAQDSALQTITADLGNNVRAAMDHMTNVHNNMANMHTDAMNKVQQVIQAVNAPKRVIRGPDNRVIGVEPVQPQLPLQPPAPPSQPMLAPQGPMQ